MANKTRQQANLVSNGNIFSNTTNNKVGIGTTNPISKLSVSGDGYFTGVVTATSFIGNITGDVTGNITGNVIGNVIGNITGTATTATTATNVISGIGSITSLSVSGISTLSSTTLIGSGTSTGTASQPLQVTGGAYVSGNLGIGTTNPTAPLSVVGSIDGTAFESYELDDLSSSADGTKNTFTPTFNYETVTITNPFRLMITINGIPQSAFINNTDYVYQSNFLGSNNGYTIDSDNNIKFTESIPTGSDIVARVLPVSNTPTKVRYYPFKPTDILLGY